MNQLAPISHAALPSAHLGLHWDHDADLDGVDALVRRCEIHDAIVPRNPRCAVTAHFTPSESTAILMGRDSSGELRAAATVRVAPNEAPGAAALRAHIDPKWRGRGIGRQVLAWQDSLAIEWLGDDSGLIGVTIPSGLVDRRRLYAAAGFSSQGRVHGYTATLEGSAHLDAAAPDGVEIVPLAEIRDPGSLTVARSRIDFISTGMLGCEGLSSANPDASFAALRDGAVIGSVLAHDTRGAHDEPMAMIHDLRPSGDAASALLAASFQALHRSGVNSAYIRLTVESLSSWEETVRDLGAVPSGAYVVYSIEWP